MDGLVETEFLIVGAGPAGASLACFLTMYGLKGIIISNNPGTADSPRAHITNQATMECLRDLGLEEEVMKIATTGNYLDYVRWCDSMAGEEYARMYAFGRAPERKGEYELASPCEHIDIPQTLLEPILIRYAMLRGFHVKFRTTFLSFDETHSAEIGGRIAVTVRDDVTKDEYQIHTKYLFGADGARSLVAKQLGLPMTVKDGGGPPALFSCVLVKADLSHLMKNRRGDLHWIVQPDRQGEAPEYGIAGAFRMVRPWDEWLVSLVQKPGFDPRTEKVSNEQYLQRMRDFIGDDTPVEILHVLRPWQVNEIYAREYSRGNIFCLGDAVHRHPPHAGLGSNTSIQDAYNLAWKIAYVETGRAGPSLLDSYSAERQPVGEGIVTRANDAHREYPALWEALGMAPPGSGGAALAELRSGSAAGEARRLRLRHAMARVAREYNGLGVEMSQEYVSTAVYAKDEKGPFALHGAAANDRVLHYQPSTYPGRRLPHAWLNRAVPVEPRSTIDLAGNGAFGLLTGHGGGPWIKAAEVVGASLGVTINTASIGFRQDWEDAMDRWQDVREIEESGAILVRPDRFVAWRAARLMPGQSVETCAKKLEEVLRSVLSITPTRF